MNAAKIIAQLDRFSETGSDEELRIRLEDLCPEYEKDYPEDAVGAAALWNELGSVCRRNAWFEKGETAFLRAAKSLEKAGIADGNYATTLNNLAGLYRMSGKWDKSFELFSRCRELYLSLQNIPVDVLASSYNNLGLLYLDKKQYAKAADEFKTAENIISAAPENLYIHAVTAGNSAYAWYGLGDMEKAAEYMRRAALTAEKLEGSEGMMFKNYSALYKRISGKELR
ncbi:MAG: tetratricopeptide repeat protein [Ruminococcaceae bacterium]|nr:tetratricopeptide repeat protein [Oscillospiraceae bacterium]